MTDVVTSPDERKKLKGVIVEMTNCLAKMDQQREQQKAIATAAEEEFGIKKKDLNKMARIMYKQNYADFTAENEHFAHLYESVCEGKIATSE